MNIAPNIKVDPIKIGGLLKFSTLDYPGKLSAVVFCQGCPNRCVYCHNPSFIDLHTAGTVRWEEVIDFLKTRRNLLDAVVFSGGEPLIQPSLISAVNEVKSMGFLVGIHTSGCFPKQFSEILKIVDWVGYDLKTVFEKYEKITQIPNSGEMARKNLELLLGSKVSYEIRTTLDSRHISQEDLFCLAKFLKNRGVRHWVIQECILRSPEGDKKLPLVTGEDLEKISEIIHVEIRKQ